MLVQLNVMAALPSSPGSPGPQQQGLVCSLLEHQQGLLHLLALLAPAFPSHLPPLLLPVLLRAQMVQVHLVLPTVGLV